MTQLTKHFSLDEFCRSNTAVRLSIDQQPNARVRENLQHTAECMEEVRELLGHPITINSGYRSFALNKAVGGAPNSDHCEGFAVDFVCPDFGTPREICIKIAEGGVMFHKLIYEGTWVHISFDPRSERSVYTAHFKPGMTTYSIGIA